MYPLRQITPSRRKSVAEKRYNSYKNELKEDFNHRCGYCDDYVGYRNTYYEIDHFIPKSLLPESRHNNYGNLVFSCRYCNNSKRDKWPTGNINQFNDGVKGFIDPCDDDYSAQFKRSKSGDIVPITELGRCMFRSLMLGRKRHSVLWCIDKLSFIIDKFDELGLDKKEKYMDLYIGINKYFHLYFKNMRDINCE